jgi:hypothetical protein
MQNPFDAMAGSDNTVSGYNSQDKLKNAGSGEHVMSHKLRVLVKVMREEE